MARGVTGPRNSHKRCFREGVAIESQAMMNRVVEPGRVTRRSNRKLHEYLNSVSTNRYCQDEMIRSALSTERDLSRINKTAVRSERRRIKRRDKIAEEAILLVHGENHLETPCNRSSRATKIITGTTSKTREGKREKGDDLAKNREANERSWLIRWRGKRRLQIQDTVLEERGAARARDIT